MPTDDPEIAALLDTTSSLLENLRRLALLAERLAARAPLTSDEANDVRKEIQATRDGCEAIETMLTLRRQQLM